MIPPPSGMANSLLVAFLTILMVCPSRADTLIEYKSGRQLRTGDLLEAEHILIYIEKNCSVCHDYVRALSNCDSSLKNRVFLVSMSTPAQTKDLARILPKDLKLFVAKDPKSEDAIFATPTTRTRRGQKIGPLSCPALTALAQPHPKVPNP